MFDEQQRPSWIAYSRSASKGVTRKLITVFTKESRINSFHALTLNFSKTYFILRSYNAPTYVRLLVTVSSLQAFQHKFFYILLNFIILILFWVKFVESASHCAVFYSLLLYLSPNILLRTCSETPLICVISIMRGAQKIHVFDAEKDFSYKFHQSVPREYLRYGAQVH